MIKIQILSHLCFLLSFTACGGNNSNGGGGLNEPARQNQEAQGFYRAFIRPLNTHTFGRINSGTATFLVDQEFQAELFMDDASAVQHMQAIYMGTKCPSETSDTNEDGFIDFKEALAVVGEALLPLDLDLSTQESLAGLYPSGMAYTFKQSASLETMMKDLRTQDDNLRDHMGKLKPNEELNLDGRVVLVHGIPLTSNLPSSVQPFSGMTAHASLPVSCGVIERVMDF